MSKAEETASPPKNLEPAGVSQEKMRRGFLNPAGGSGTRAKAEKTPSPPRDLPELPDALWLNIAQRLDPPSLYSFSSVDKRFRSIVKRDVLVLMGRENTQQGCRCQNCLHPTLRTDLRVELYSGGLGLGTQTDQNRFPSMSADLVRWFHYVCKAEHARGLDYERALMTLASLAAKHGHLDVLKELRDQHGCAMNEDHFKFAAGNGHMDVLTWLYDIKAPWDVWTCAFAAQSGYLSVLKWLRARGAPWDSYTAAWAARYKHRHIIEYVWEEGGPLNMDLLTSAAEAGDLGVLSWATEALELPWHKFVCSEAAEHNRIEVLRFARAGGCPWDEETCENAAREGHLDVLKWARAQDPPCPWNWRTCAEAAAGGHLDVLKWCRAQTPPCPWNEDTCSEAAEGGHLEVLKWARSEDPPCPFSLDGATFSLAAKGGTVEMLQYLWSEGCPLNHYSTAFAAVAGNLDNLKFLCGVCKAPISSFVAMKAAEGDHLEVLKWLRESLDPPCPWNASACTGAAEAGSIEILAYLRQNGCPWNADAFLAAAGRGHLAVLKWLRSHGCPGPDQQASPGRPQVCAAAADGGHLEVLKWLRSEFSLPWGGTCALAAVRAGRLQTLKWLVATNDCPWNASDCLNLAMNCGDTHRNIEQWVRRYGAPGPQGTAVLCELGGASYLDAMWGFSE